MSTHIESRLAISTLFDAGKTPTEIVNELNCSRHIVYTVKYLKKAGKDLKLNRRRYNIPVLTPTIHAGIKSQDRPHEVLAQGHQRSWGKS